MRKSTSGFTLVELLIVIVVIAIMAAIAIVSYNGIQERANAASVATSASQYLKLMKLYKIDHGHYPYSYSEIYPDSQSTCMGVPEDYPAEDDYSAGYCLYSMTYEPWRVAASNTFTADLQQYGTIPEPRTASLVYGNEVWRGIYYSRGTSGGDETIMIRWLTRGTNIDYCALANGAVVSSAEASNGVVFCEIYLREPMG